MSRTNYMRFSKSDLSIRAARERRKRAANLIYNGCFVSNNTTKCPKPLSSTRSVSTSRYVGPRNARTHLPPFGRLFQPVVCRDEFHLYEEREEGGLGARYKVIQYVLIRPPSMLSSSLARSLSLSLRFSRGFKISLHDVNLHVRVSEYNCVCERLSFSLSDCDYGRRIGTRDLD